MLSAPGGARALRRRGGGLMSSSFRQGLSTKSTAPLFQRSPPRAPRYRQAVIETTDNAGSMTRMRARALGPSRPLCCPSANFMSSSTPRFPRLTIDRYVRRLPPKLDRREMPREGCCALRAGVQPVVLDDRAPCRTLLRSLDDPPRTTTVRKRTPGSCAPKNHEANIAMILVIHPYVSMSSMDTPVVLPWWRRRIAAEFARRHSFGGSHMFAFGVAIRRQLHEISRFQRKAFRSAPSRGAPSTTSFRCAARLVPGATIYGETH